MAAESMDTFSTMTQIFAGNHSLLKGIIPMPCKPARMTEEGCSESLRFKYGTTLEQS